MKLFAMKHFAEELKNYLLYNAASLNFRRCQLSICQSINLTPILWNILRKQLLSNDASRLLNHIATKRNSRFDHIHIQKCTSSRNMLLQ